MADIGTKENNKVFTRAGLTARYTAYRAGTAAVYILLGAATLIFAVRCVGAGKPGLGVIPLVLGASLFFVLLYRGWGKKSFSDRCGDRVRLVENEDDLYAFAASPKYSVWLRVRAASALHDADKLRALLSADLPEEVRLTVLMALGDEDAMHQLALSPYPELRLRAARAVADETVLTELVRSDPLREVRQIAMERLSAEAAVRVSAELPSEDGDLAYAAWRRRLTEKGKPLNAGEKALIRSLTAGALGSKQVCPDCLGEVESIPETGADGTSHCREYCRGCGREESGHFALSLREYTEHL